MLFKIVGIPLLFTTCSHIVFRSLINQTDTIQYYPKEDTSNIGHPQNYTEHIRGWGKRTIKYFHKWGLKVGGVQVKDSLQRIEAMKERKE